MSPKPFFQNRKRQILFILLLAVAFVPAFVTQGQNTAPESTTILFDPALHQAGFIEVKFAEGSNVRLRDGQLTDFGRGAVSVAAETSDIIANGRWAPLSSVSETELDALRTSTQAIDPALPDLNLYYRLFLDDDQSPNATIKSLTQLELVEGAYPVPKVGPAALPPDYATLNDGNADADYGYMYQRYADEAPEGIDARYAWQGFHGTGNGINICNIERGYNTHTDLPSIREIGPGPKVLTTVYGSRDNEHGTAVLGVMGAKNNDWGIRGLAHDADLLFSTPSRIIFFVPFQDITDAVIRCTNELSKGDVIIIEQQIQGPGPALCDEGQEGCVPVEYHKPTYDAIKVAVAQGIVVIEAAGNGNNNLDQGLYNPGHNPFNVSNDSGAILVGAANSDYTISKRERSSFSNYGSTVDLYAWGDSIIAPGKGSYYDLDGPAMTYTLFGGTSGASPIVASAAAIVQSNYKAKNGDYASPAVVKSLLTSTGTPQENENGDNIGVQPNLRGAIEEIWGIEEIAAPIITPDTGTYQMPLQATIDYGDSSQNSSNTHIRYTLNGTEPTEDSFVFLPDQGDTLYLNYGVTVRAKAFSNFGGSGYVAESETTTVIYLSNTPKVATPQISPDGGTFDQGTQLILSTSTAGAEIRYRLDGRTPSFFYPGTVYEGPVTLPIGSHDVVARGYKDGYYKSDAAHSSNTITINPIQLPVPVVYPNGGTFTGEVSVYLGSTVLGADIRYTLDGSEPTSSSNQFIEPIALTADTTVKVKVFLDAYTPSETVTKEFEVIGEVDPPVITPADGSTATDTLQVSMSTSTSGATIRYTTNGAEPTSYSAEYSGPFNLGHGEHTVKAKAFLTGAAGSSTTTAEYTVYDPALQIDPPVIYPPVGNYNGPITVTITSETEGVFISYTTDGSDPFTSGTVKPYNGPFSLPGAATDYFVRARAFKADANPSSVASNVHRLTVVNPTLGQVITPTIDPPSGTYTNTFTAKVTATDHQAPFRIRGLHITEDGTLPLVNLQDRESGAVPFNVNVSSSKTVKAVSSQVGWVDSPVASADYLLKCDTPKIMTGGTYTGTAEVSLSSGTTAAEIYYSIDGSNPNEGGDLYDGPFTLEVGEHTVQAICSRTNFEPSEIAVEAFIVQAEPETPTFTTQPTDQTGEVCGSAEFSTQANATPDPTYQWFKDGEIMASENEPSLELAILREDDAGNYTVVATNSAGSATSNTATLTVNDTGATCFDQPKQEQTISFEAPVLTGTVGMTLSLEATATSGLMVDFESTTADVCTVDGTIVSPLSGGTCTINALQLGNDEYEPAPIVTRSFAVEKRSQTIKFSPQENAVMINKSVTMSATASSGLGITFESLTTSICTISGDVVTADAEGICTVLATQSGNDVYASAQAAQSFQVTSKQIQTISFPTPSGTDALEIGDTFEVAASSDSGLAVSLRTDTPAVCSLSGTTVTVLTNGTCTITASQAGNGTFETAPDVSQSFVIGSDPGTGTDITIYLPVITR